jgi:hypothetical protein
MIKIRVWHNLYSNAKIAKLESLLLQGQLGYEEMEGRPTYENEPLRRGTTQIL